MRRRLASFAAITTILAGVVGLAVVTGSPAQVAGPVTGSGGGGTPDGVTVNRTPAAAGTYWTEDRMDGARELTPSRGGVSAGSYGTSNLDFTRSRVSPKTAAKVAPYKTAGKLFFTKPGQGDYVCSASVIAKRLVLTAAHCMYSSDVGFHTNWIFIPGYDGTASTVAGREPFGRWSWTRGQVPTAWIDSGGALPNNNDFGILVMADQSFNGAPPSNIASKVGKFNTAVGHLADTMVTMLGYPCNFDSCNIMQRNDTSDHRHSGVSGSTAYEYGSDMTGGSSGGPWVENFGDASSAAPTGGYSVRNTVVAVTSYVYNDANVRVLGASNLNANFTTIRNDSCASGTGNC